MTETKNTTSDKLAKASQVKRALKNRASEVDSKIERSEDRLSDHLLAAADGEEVPAELHHELAGLLAEKMAFTLALSKAEAECKKAQDRVFTRGLKENEREMRALTVTSDEISGRIERTADTLAQQLRELYVNGQEIARLFHGLRGKNMQTSKGVIAFDVGEMASGGHVQHLFQLHMVRRIKDWDYDRVPSYVPTFSEGVRNARAALFSEWGQLMGVDGLDPEDVAAVEADMVADGLIEGKAPVRRLYAGPVTQDGETDVEALMAATPPLRWPGDEPPAEAKE